MPLVMVRYKNYDDIRWNCWEQHVQNMLEQATAYAKSFPELEQVHLGCFNIEISRDDSQMVLKMASYLRCHNSTHTVGLDENGGDISA